MESMKLFFKDKALSVGLTIALQSYGMKEMRKSGPTVAVDLVTGSCSCIGCQPRLYAGEGPQATVGHLSRGRLKVRHIPGGRQPPGPG